MNDKYRVLQDDLKDCGVCSLLSIIKYYHGNASKEYLRELTKTDNNGVSALNLLKGARTLGFEAYGVKGKIESISRSVLPIIAHVIIDKKYPHFVVVYQIDIKRNKVLVMDPAKGFIYYAINNFMKISTGYYLILKPKQQIPKLTSKEDFKDRIGKKILDYKIVFVSIIIMSLIYTLINIISSYNFKLLYEENTISIAIILGLLVFIKYLID